MLSGITFLWFGMITVRRPGDSENVHSEHKRDLTHKTMATMPVKSAKPSTAAVVRMGILSIVLFGVGVGLSFVFSGSH